MAALEPAASRDYYEILGVERDAELSAIQKTYKKLALKHHPDRNRGPNQAEAAAKFAEIGEAYSVLSDPDSRRNYDLHGHSDKGAQANQFESHNVQELSLVNRWAAAQIHKVRSSRGQSNNPRVGSWQRRPTWKPLESRRAPMPPRRPISLACPSLRR